MQTNYERYCKMSSLAQIGWWEADFLAGHYVCSDFLCDLLGLEGDTISFMDFQNLIREDYREQIVQEFRANANIHKDFYEQTFPICLKNGEVWLHTRLALREKGTGTIKAVVCISLSITKTIRIIVARMKSFRKVFPKRKTSSSPFRLMKPDGGVSRFYLANPSY